MPEITEQKKPADQTKVPLSIERASVTAEDIAKAVVIAQSDVNRMLHGQEKTPDMDKTIPGGRYLVNGNWVDAYGKKINGPGT